MRFRDKLQIFVFGLTVGLLAGCLFFIFKLDNYVRKLDLSILKQKTPVTEVMVETKKEPEEKENKESKPFKNPERTDTLPKKHESLISLNDITDSSYLESENYQVLKEELISVKNLYVKTIGPEEKISTTDSLIAALAGVSSSKNREEYFMIEFWKTPLNSKGYKMSRNRLLIYGYPENKDLALVKKDDNYYLRNNGLVYRLNYSAEFKAMERSADMLTTAFN